MEERVTIGVLALQGDFAAHGRAFERLGCVAREIRWPQEISAVDGLVIPGGETTTLIKLLRESGLWEAIGGAPDSGRPLFGTCAGMILLAEEVHDPRQDCLGLLPIVVQRNAYGRQVDSFVTPGEISVPEDLRAAHLASDPALRTELVFIRAPRIVTVRGPLDVLARHAGTPVLVRRGPVLAASFHPELTADGAVQRIFLAMVALARARRRGGNGGGRSARLSPAPRKEAGA